MKESRDADLRLVRSVLAHDADAKELLARRLACVGRMLTARNRELGSPLTAEELEDVAGEVVARVLTKLDGYAGLAALESWIYAFCEGELRNTIRRKRRRAVREGTADEIVEAAGPAVPEPHEDVHLCVDALPAAEQRLVRWKHFDGLSLEAISQRTESKLNTTKSRYFRVLQALRACLERRQKRTRP